MGKWQIRFCEDFCKGCMLCVEMCPEKVFKKTDRLNKRGYFLPTIAHPEKCTGCMLCEHICPDMVVEVRRIEKISPPS